MKLLKKQQINERVNEERKNNINAGVFLAKKVDALREEVLTLQKTRDEFIAGSQAVINDSLYGLQFNKDSLSKEVKELEVRREELLKPLDDKWNEVNEIQKKVLAEKEENRLDREEIKEDEKIIETTKKEISTILANARYKGEEADKARNETLSLKELAQKEYEIARNNREAFDRESERKLSELQGKITTYENGISINETKEKDLEKREVALLKEIKHLESQQRIFKIAKGIK